ncbi:MAG: hypothetical protein ACYTG4_12080 [Planctomycetota bacterium]|jgi:hypothetical protein
MKSLRMPFALLAALVMAVSGCGGDDREGITDAEREDNEARAMATLRSINTAQKRLLDDVLIDCDSDGIGEYGTIKELTGTLGLRLHQENEPETGMPYSDFTERGAPISPGLLDPVLGNLDREGIVLKAGYCFRLFLPDSASPPRFVNEVQELRLVSLKGGSLKIGTDAAEQYWCAYAWPVKAGVTGNRVFFINQEGKVMASSNEEAKWSGKEHAPPGNSAYSKSFISSEAADVEIGRDGDTWKAAN